MTTRLKVVFFGTPDVAKTLLDCLIDHEVNIVAIVTRPDRAKGRSKKLCPTPVKICAQTRLPDVTVYQPEKASTVEFEKVLKALDADLFIVVAYGEIIKQTTLDIPKLDCINVHFSLLPRWRGAAPMQHALLAGDKETGVTIIKMVKAMDAGEILAAKAYRVPDDLTCGELSVALCELAGPLLLDLIHQYAAGAVCGKEQDPALITLAPKITPEMTKIYFNRPAIEVHNQIRALSPTPGAWCDVMLNGAQKRLKILRTTLKMNGIWSLDCKESSLAIEEVQLEGKKRISAKEFIRGYPDVQIIF